MRPTRTLISHFFNEEYLLPWWLRHHLPLFDHAILINRNSTDRSVEICRELAPSWEVRPSTVPEFDAFDVDREVMAIEQDVRGWKMALNTTEFLCVRHPREFFESLDRLGHSTYGVPMLMMVDDPDYGYREPTYARPLVDQRHHGTILKLNIPVPTFFNGRFIHKRSHGSYMVGRHWSTHAFTTYPSPALLLKFFYSPWNDAMRRRKLQFAPTLSAHSRQLGLGIHHIMSVEEHEHTYRKYARDTRNLRTLAVYRQVFGGWSPDAQLSRDRT